jgi:hypothetical protein
MRQTRDYIQLPEPYGRGSSTIKKWIEERMAEDAAAAAEGTERRFADPSESTSSTWPDKNLVGMTAGEFFGCKVFTMLFWYCFSF